MALPSTAPTEAACGLPSASPEPVAAVPVQSGGPPARSWGVWDVAALGSILLFAALLRFPTLDQQSLWMDELVTIGQANGVYYADAWPRVGEFLEHPPRLASPEAARPLAQIWSLRGQDQHPPLYLYAFRLWRALFGPSDYAGRSLSAVLSLAAIVLLYDVGRQLLGRTAAAWACLILAVAVPQVAYAQEMRSYALLMVFGLGALSALVRIERCGPAWRRLLALGLCVLAMPLTHYFSLGALLALGVYSLERLRGRCRRRVVQTFVTAGALFLLIWGPILWQQRAGINHPFLADGGPNRVRNLTWHFASLPVRLLSELRWREADPVPALLAGLVILSVPGLMLRRRRELLLPYLWLVGTAGLVAGLDLVRSTRQLDFIRYTLLAGPGVYLLCAGLLLPSSSAPAASPASMWRRWPIWRHLPPAAAFAFAALALPPAYEVYKEDWRGAARYVQRSAGPGDCVIIDRRDEAVQTGWRPHIAYLALDHYASGPDHPTLFLDAPPAGPLRERLRNFGTLWVISSAEVRPLLPEAKVVQAATFSGACTVYRAAWR